MGGSDDKKKSSSGKSKSHKEKSSSGKKKKKEEAAEAPAPAAAADDASDTESSLSEGEKASVQAAKRDRTPTITAVRWQRCSRVLPCAWRASRRLRPNATKAVFEMFSLLSSPRFACFCGRFAACQALAALPRLSLACICACSECCSPHRRRSELWGCRSRAACAAAS